MAVPVLKCETHGEPTRISCVECGRPVWPRCMVRTEVGTKCETCAARVAPRIPAVRRSRLPWMLAVVGLCIVIGSVVAVILLRGGGTAVKNTAGSRPLGSWSAQPNLGNIRGTTAVVRLQNGQVLAAGGGVGAIPGGSAEASGTLLSDGRVLIAGGFGGPGAPGGAGGIQYNPLTSTEGYDPAVGAFSATGQMINARADHVAARLADGTVLVAGGLGGSTGGVSVATAERFDPTTGRWREVSPMTRARTGASAALLGNGRVLVAGGESVDTGVRNSLDSAELFHANTSTWLPARIMSCPRSGLGAVT